MTSSAQPRLSVLAALFAALLTVLFAAVSRDRASAEPNPDAMVSVELSAGPAELSWTPPSELDSSFVFGADGRTQVTNTTAAGMRTIALLEVHREDGSIVGCSGAMLNTNVLLTAAHCVYRPDQASTSYVIVRPAASYPNAPFGAGRATRFLYHNAWPTEFSPEYDYALLFMDETPWGGQLGPYYTVAALPDSFFVDPSTFLRTTGYPGDKPFGTMWTTESNQFVAFSLALSHALDVTNGQSGSPVFALNGGQLYIASVVSASEQTGTNSGQNLSPRLTPSRIAALNEACAVNNCTIQTTVVAAGSLTATASVTPSSTATATASASATATATMPAGTGLTVTPNTPYVAGANAVVVQGGGPVATAVAGIGASSGRRVLAMWLFAGGRWLFYIPGPPPIEGGLGQFPGPVAAAFAILG